MNSKNKILFAVKEGEDYMPKEWNWDYCKENKIPYIMVRPKSNYAHISISLDTVDDSLVFSDDTMISKFWQNFYEEYTNEYNFPIEMKKYIGTCTDFNIVIWKKDYPEFVTKFTNYILDILVEYAEVDLLLKEYTLLNRETKEIMNGSRPGTKEDLDNISAIKIDLRYKIWDKDFNRIETDDDERMIKLVL